MPVEFLVRAQLLAMRHDVMSSVLDQLEIKQVVYLVGILNLVAHLNVV